MNPDHKFHRDQHMHGRQSVLSFLRVMFVPSDWVEFRIIETWSDDNRRKCSQPLERFWLTPREILDHFPRLQQLNTIGNVFFGVNPRATKGGTKADVAECRSIWVDLDNITLSEAAQRWERIEMPPSIVVNSGHGIHAYWKLVDSVNVIDPGAKRSFESLVKRFATVLGGDATHDCTRLLRLPGTQNVKGLRNGQMPVPCTLVSLDETRIYPRSAFAAFESDERETTASYKASSGKEPVLVADDSPLYTATIGRTRDHQRIRGILRYLDREVPDRSKRDLSALVLLIQAGLSKSEIQSLVGSRSKFMSAGDGYFERTFSAAHRLLGRQANSSPSHDVNGH